MIQGPEQLARMPREQVMKAALRWSVPIWIFLSILFLIDFIFGVFSGYAATSLSFPITSLYFLILFTYPVYYFYVASYLFHGNTYAKEGVRFTIFFNLFGLVYVVALSFLHIGLLPSPDFGDIGQGIYIFVLIPFYALLSLVGFVVIIPVVGLIVRRSSQSTIQILRMILGIMIVFVFSVILNKSINIQGVVGRYLPTDEVLVRELSKIPFEPVPQGAVSSSEENQYSTQNQWQIYIDEKYGFSFEYPPLAEIGRHGIGSGRETITISTLARDDFNHGVVISEKFPNEKDLSLSGWVQKTYPSREEDLRPSIINGYNAVTWVIVTPAAPFGASRFVFLEKDDLVATFFWPEGTFSPEYQRVLDSFRFE